MTKEFANAVYDVLVSYVGAYEGTRPSFVFHCAESPEPVEEFRFGGKLGFGGKYWTRDNRVSCYPEDETRGRRALIEMANEELVQLKIKMPKE